MVKTTYEMDGLFTKEDIANRYKIWYQCRNCSKWTLQDTEKDKERMFHALNPCSNIKCGKNDFDLTSATSMRTFNPSNKRKVKK